MPFVSGALPSWSTRSVSTVTAMVVIDADPLADELAEAAITVDVLDVPSVAVVGGVTLTHMAAVAPATRSGVAVIGVAHAESKNVTGKVPPADDRL